MRHVVELLGMPIIVARGGFAYGTVTAVELDVVRGRVCFLHVSPGDSLPEIAVPWSSVCTVESKSIIVFGLPSPGSALAPTRTGVLSLDPSRVQGDLEQPHSIVGYEIDEITGRVFGPSHEPAGHSEERVLPTIPSEWERLAA